MPSTSVKIFISYNYKKKKKCFQCIDTYLKLNNFLFIFKLYKLIIKYTALYMLNTH
jgi:hypothetical protein